MLISSASHTAKGQDKPSNSTIHREQRRVGHICAILIRNLSLRPTRDRALQTLASRRPGGSSIYHTTSDDADLTLSLSRSSSKGKGKASDGSQHRRRSASWWNLAVGSSDDDEGTDELDTSAASTFSRSPLNSSRSDGKNDRRGRPALLVNRRRTSDHELTSTSSPLGATSEGVHSFEPNPRPILKRSSSTRDGREMRLHAGSPGAASASGFLDEIGANTTILSRSDSRSSSRSSHTIRRPSHRARTTSMTSSSSVRSVRFDESHVGAVDVARRPSRISGRLNAASRYMLFSQKSLAQIMQERMLECFVELSLSSGTTGVEPGSSVRPRVSESGNPGPVFYRTSYSKPGLHHSWGYHGGDPIHPERDFAIDAETSACVTPLEASVVAIKVWARLPIAESGGSATQIFSSATNGKVEEWKLVCRTTVDLRDLEPLAGNLQDASLSLPPNAVLLGLAPGANSLSGRASTSVAGSQAGLEDMHSNGTSNSEPKLTRKVSEREAERTRHILESVIYYSVPLYPAEQDHASRADSKNELPGRQEVEDSSTKEGPRDSRLNRSPKQHRRAAVEGYASDPENAPSRKSVSTSLREQSPSDALPSSSSANNADLVPAATAATPEARRRERRKVFEDEQRRALELSLRETKMMPSYTLDEALQLARKQAEMQDLLAEVDELRHRNGSLLQHPEGFAQLRLKREQQKATCEAVRRMTSDEADDLEQRKATLEHKRSALAMRRNAIRASEVLFRAAEATRDKLGDGVRALRSQKADLQLRVHAQQASLLRDLETIFPIELCDASSLLFSICGLPLPNAVASVSQVELTHEEKRWKETAKRHKPASTRPVFHPFDDDTISSALGLVAQLVVLLSTYLATPVHYPLATAGSRAVVQDGISLMSGPRAFPLYAKGMERYRYEYAAFLLNKDIEQLMNVHSVTVIDIRHTLPNLKNLMVTVAAAPPTSQLTRKSHIGKNEIALRSATTIPLSRESDEVVETGGRVVESNDKRSSLGLGLGLPNRMAAKTEATPDTLVTTRVLGASSQPTASPATASGAIASVSRAFSYFSGGGGGGTAR